MSHLLKQISDNTVQVLKRLNSVANKKHDLNYVPEYDTDVDGSFVQTKQRRLQEMLRIQQIKGSTPEKSSGEVWSDYKQMLTDVYSSILDKGK